MHKNQHDWLTFLTPVPVEGNVDQVTIRVHKRKTERLKYGSRIFVFNRLDSKRSILVGHIDYTIRGPEDKNCCCEIGGDFYGHAPIACQIRPDTLRMFDYHAFLAEANRPRFLGNENEPLMGEFKIAEKGVRP